MHPDNCHELSCQHQVFKKELHVIIGREIKTLRKSKGITGYELGSIIKLSQQQISRYENGDSAVPLDTLILILRIFNISPEKFIHRVLLVLNRDPDSKKLLSHMSNYFDACADSTYFGTFEQYKHN